MNFRFKPYKGKTYGSDGHRLLILGESHYGTNYVGDDEQPTSVMQRWLDGGVVKTLSNTARLLTGHTTADIHRRRSLYFNGCIFYNYFQVYVGEKPRQFFTGQSKADIAQRFNEQAPYLLKLIQEHRPTHILGWGWRLGEGILRMQSDDISTSAHAFGDGFHEILAGNHRCAAMFVQHPSAPVDLYKKHAARIEPFLMFNGGVRLTALYNESAAKVA